MMKESALRNKLVKALKPHCHVVKVENSVAVGTPDLYICYKGRSAWIELKAFDKPPKDIGQKNQASWRREKLWMQEHVKNGGKCFVVVYSKEGFDISRPIANNAWSFYQRIDPNHIDAVAHLLLHETEYFWEK